MWFKDNNKLISARSSSSFLWLQPVQSFLCLQPTSVSSKEPLLFWTVMQHTTPESISGTFLHTCIFTLPVVHELLCVRVQHMSTYSSSVAASGGIEAVCRSVPPMWVGFPCARALSLLARRGQATSGITPVPWRRRLATILTLHASKSCEYKETSVLVHGFLLLSALFFTIAASFAVLRLGLVSGIQNFPP